jgi:CRP-like cAMP-binding protein
MRPPVAEALTSSPLALLDRCILFRALDEDSRRDLAARAHRRRYQAGDTIFTAGGPGHSMMGVLSGRVRITLPLVKGREVVLADLPAGEVFGEVALLDGRDRSASATAISETELLILDRAHVLPILEARADVCLRLLSLVCDRLRRSDERMADIAFSDLPSRLAKLLLARTEGLPPPGRLRLSQLELATMIGGSRENVNRQLRAWQRRGFVELGIGSVTIRSRGELASIANVV